MGHADRVDLARDGAYVDETLIDAVLYWPRQQSDFARDGSLRDLYVLNATVEDWRLVVTQLLCGDYRARLQRGGIEVPLPSDFEAVFDGNDRHFMGFTVGDIELDCHFFTPTQIEFSFEPNDVDERSLRDVLAFMIYLGDVVGKTVIMTPENVPESPFFSYDPNEHRLMWTPSG